MRKDSGQSEKMDAKSVRSRKRRTSIERMLDREQRMEQMTTFGARRITIAKHQPLSARREKKSTIRIIEEEEEELALARQPSFGLDTNNRASVRIKQSASPTKPINES